MNQYPTLDARLQNALAELEKKVGKEALVKATERLAQKNAVALKTLLNMI